jgi:hypothetical protein
LVGAAQEEQRFRQVDRPRVHEVESLDELDGVAVRVVSSHVEQCLCDRQRGAQLVGGVRRKPLLFGDMGLQPGKHRVERIGELAELVIGPFQPDSMGKRSARGGPRGARDAGEGIEDPAGEDPAAHEAEQQQEHSTATAAGVNARTRSALRVRMPPGVSIDSGT